MSDQYLLLKWGSLKGWNVADNAAALDAIKRYFADPVSVSAMAQRDTADQQQAIIDLIDVIDGEIINDWSGERYSKEQAKQYIINYDRRGS